MRLLITRGNQQTWKVKFLSAEEYLIFNVHVGLGKILINVSSIFFSGIKINLFST